MLYTAQVCMFFIALGQHFFRRVLYDVSIICVAFPRSIYMKTFLGYMHSFTTEHIVYSFLYHHLLLYFIEIVVP